MLPYKLRAPVYGSVEENKLRKTDGTDETILSGGGPMPKAIALDLKAFQKTVVTHFHGLKGNIDDGTKWGSGKAFRVFKQLFGAGKIGLLHWLLPHIKCDQEAYSQIIYAACFECFRDSFDLTEKCTAVMILYTLYETNPLVRTGDLKPEDCIPVGLHWRDYPRAMFRRAFRQRIRIDRTTFIHLLRLREECRISIDRFQGEAIMAPLTGVAGDTLVIMDRLSSHWDFCEYTGPVGLEALAGHAHYPYREYQEEDARPVQAYNQSVSYTAGTIETASGQGALARALKEYQSAVQSIHLGSAKKNSVSHLRKTLNPVLPQDGKPSWLVRINLAEANGQPVGSFANQDVGLSTINREDKTDPLESQPLPSMVHQPQHKGTHRLVVPGEIPEKLQTHLQDALEELLQRHGTAFMEKDDGFQVETRNDLMNDLSTLGGVGAATVATGQGKAALETLLSTVQAPAKIPTRVGASSILDRYDETPTTSLNRFLYADLQVDSENEEDDSSAISNISFDSENDQHDDNDEASAATSAIGQRALDMLLSKVSKPKTKSSAPGQRKTPRRKRSKPSPDEQSKASSVGVGQGALSSLLQLVASRKTKSRNLPAARNVEASEGEGNPPGRKRTRLKADEASPPQPRREERRNLDPEEHSMVSSVGAGNMALGELLKLAGKKSAQRK